MRSERIMTSQKAARCIFPARMSHEDFLAASMASVASSACSNTAMAGIFFCRESWLLSGCSRFRCLVNR